MKTTKQKQSDEETIVECRRTLIDLAPRLTTTLQMAFAFRLKEVKEQGTAEAWTGLLDWTYAKLKELKL